MYNTVGGKLNRGMGVVDVLRAFAEKEGRELRHEEVSDFLDPVKRSSFIFFLRCKIIRIR